MVKHDTLLLCSSSRENRQELRRVFADAYHLLESGDPRHLVMLLRQNLGCIAAVLLDVSRMEPQDRKWMAQQENRTLLSSVPVIVLTDRESPELLNRAFGMGAADVICVKYDHYAMLRRVENILDLYLHKQHLEAQLKEQKELRQQSVDAMVDALSSIIEYRSVETGQHILRIRHFTRVLLEEVARSCPEYQLTEETIAIICSASALHDIGKIAIPDEILMKAGKLTGAEREIMQTHAATGCRILASLENMADKEYLRYAHEICRYHHERWDGGGYPDGLRGDAIPICAQVVGLADVYDALTSRRVYKEAYSFSKAVNMIFRGECGAFSPKLLDCFKHVLHSFEILAEEYVDGKLPEESPLLPTLPQTSDAEDVMERLRGKYYALVHYINGLLIELDMDRQMFHLVYNPYPELASLREMDTLEEIANLLCTQLVHPEDREKMERFIGQDIDRFLDEGLRRASHYFRFNNQSASVSDVFELTLLRINPLDNSRLVTDQTGQEVICSYLVDTQELHREDTLLQQKLQCYEMILAQTENVLFEWDVIRNTVGFSDTWKKIFGYNPVGNDAQWSQQWLSYIHPDDLPLLLDCIGSLHSGSPYEVAEVRMATAQGRYLWCRFRATAIRDARGDLQKISGIIINIDAEKKAAQALQSRAEQDSLTKLLNKDAARKQAEEYFARYSAGVGGALLIIDLDDFKQINDQRGHLFGDAVLVKVAQEIRKLFRGQDIVARIGGDEFMVVMRGVTDELLLDQRCQQLEQILRNVFRSYNLSLTCSIGIALSPLHGQSYYELFQHADQALYQIKATGKHAYAIYSPENSGYWQQEHTGRASKPIDSDNQPGMANDNVVRYAFQKLYSSQNIDASINELLGFIGQQLNVSRVYVFENSEDNRSCRNTYEWCNRGISPEIQNLQHISYETDLPNYADNFDEEGIFYCPDVAILPKNVYDIVVPQGIQAMLHCAIRENGVFRGYIGFDDCKEPRMWTKEQIALLRFFSESLSVFLLRQRRQEKLQRQAEELNFILDNQDAWSYVVDPDTYELRYVNSQLRKKVLQSGPGKICYQILENRESPCNSCPMAMLKDRKNYSCLHNSGSGEKDLLLEAVRIQWNGERDVLISGRRLPKA